MFESLDPKCQVTFFFITISCGGVGRQVAATLAFEFFFSSYGFQVFVNFLRDPVFDSIYNL